jgi:hypothetical protein
VAFAADHVARGAPHRYVNWMRFVVCDD